MSTEVIAEVVVEESVDSMRDEIRAQVKLSSVIRDYIESKERFESASMNYSENCQAVRDVIKPSTTIVVNGGYGMYYGKHFLLQTDDKGNFKVEPVEVI